MNRARGCNTLQRTGAMTYYGRVSNGVVVVEGAPDLPEGAEVRVELVSAGRALFGSSAFIVGVAQAAACIALCMAALSIVPRFERVFKDFGTKLPNMTEIILNLTGYLGRYWYLLLPPICAWPFVNWGIVSLVSPRPGVGIAKLLWYLATCFAISLVIMFGVMALFAPLLELMDHLSRT